MRGRCLAVIALGLLAAFMPIGNEQGREPLAQATAGKILLPRGFKLLQVDPNDGSEHELYTASQVLMSAAWSPDSRRVAFAQFSRRPGDRYGGSEIYLLDGDQASLVADRAGADVSYNSAQWTPDGLSLVYQATTPMSGGFSIEQIGVDGSNRRTLESNAASPALSPGGQLAFVRLGGTDSLIIRPLDGGRETDLLPPNSFIGLNWPRFSPDGRRIAFLGIGGPAALRSHQPADPLAALRLGPASALAHGIPWDPWMVNVDGSGLHLVANMSEDDPTAAWSPDGTALAVLGGGGLWIVPLDGSNPALIGVGNYGVIDWRP